MDEISAVIMNNKEMSQPKLTDPFNRTIRYLRLSVTDRCDFRCVYCMAEEMTFLPRKNILSIEELSLIGESFAQLGVTKVRITGGEPLIRNNIIQLFNNLGATEAIKDLCVTTNGSQLAQYASALKTAGVTSINISLDSLSASKFHTITRHGNLAQVIEGIRAAKKSGVPRVKINSVILKNQNFDEVLPLTDFALNEGVDISFIEEMPLGEINSHKRETEFVKSQTLREVISTKYSLSEYHFNSGGPSRYWRIDGYNNRIGFISPHSDNFCASCNRVRVTATGKLLLCLGNDHAVDLKAILRNDSPDKKHELLDAISQSMQIKPEKHHFDLSAPVDIVRFMNTTGG